MNKHYIYSKIPTISIKFKDVLWAHSRQAVFDGNRDVIIKVMLVLKAVLEK
jgi:hypothetical protein